MNAPSNNHLDSPSDDSIANPCNIIVTHTAVDDEGPVVYSNQSRPITRGMMRERAVQLAVTHGRLPHETSKADWEAAKRETVDWPKSYASACYA